MPSLIVANVWKEFPFAMIMLLAGLQTVPQQLLNAARVDGANAWNRFWHVTVPTLRGVIIITSILLFVGNLNSFGLVWIMTGGGPANASQIWITEVYTLAFQSLQYGRASAYSVILFVVMLCLGYFYVRALTGGGRKREARRWPPSPELRPRGRVAARGWTRPRIRALDVLSVVWLVVLLAFARDPDAVDAVDVAEGPVRRARHSRRSGFPATRHSSSTRPCSRRPAPIGPVFLRYFLNSMIVSASTTLLGVLIAIPAAYAFSRFQFPGPRRAVLRRPHPQHVPGRWCS